MTKKPKKNNRQMASDGISSAMQGMKKSFFADRTAQPLNRDRIQTNKRIAQNEYVHKYIIQKWLSPALPLVAEPTARAFSGHLKGVRT